MSRLIYSDSLQADEELRNFFAAINLRDRPQNSSPTTSANNAPSPAAPRSSGPVVDGNHGQNIAPIQQSCKDLQQGGNLASPAKDPRPLVHEIDNRQGKLSDVMLFLSVCSLYTVRHDPPSVPTPGSQNPVYSVPSGKRTGIRETW